jgi:hypothetical protein
MSCVADGWGVCLQRTWGEVPDKLKTAFGLTKGASYKNKKKRWTFPLSSYDDLISYVRNHLHDKVGSNTSATRGWELTPDDHLYWTVPVLILLRGW